MPSYSHTETVNAAPESIFAVLEDVARTPEWLARCTQLDKLSDGPVGVGTKLRYHYTQGRQSGVMDGEVVAFAANQRLTNKFTDSMMNVSVDFALAPGEAAGTTSLTHTIDIEAKGFLGKLLTPVISRQLPDQTKGAMAALKALVEGSA
ncbi:MAG: SRPBCC family protein [Marmoricola sp.]|mgnify:FL=1